VVSLRTINAPASSSALSNVCSGGDHQFAEFYTLPADDVLWLTLEGFEKRMVVEVCRREHDRHDQHKRAYH
jgi:hypothetical protein